MGRFEQARENIRRAYEAGRASVRAARAEQTRRYEETQFEPEEPTAAAIVHNSTTSRDDAEVPGGLRVAAAWSWRLLIVGALAWFVLYGIVMLSTVVIPLIIALLLAALFSPAVSWLRQIGLNRSIATTIVVIAGIALVAGTLTAVISSFVTGLPEVTTNAKEGLREVENWMRHKPLNLTDLQFTKIGDAAQKWFDDNRDAVTTGFISTATTTLHVLAGFFLVLFSLFFLLRDGRQIWRFFVGLMPAATREPLDFAGIAAWHSLVSYVRATIIVAFIDAVGIYIAMVILDVPLKEALAALVFLFSFVPILGATISGTIAVLVALVAKDPLTALILLAAVIGVQQFEGHVLQPLIMGRAVAIHPLAVILAIAGGLVIAGIIGALIAVPMIAMLNTGIRALVARRRAASPEALAEAALPTAT
ncbi:putative PurR-regulated permease PerM [Allocatelliglobosispora scoriae]|uniref:Putative PurR-regulated permease PerM n=1 Tax=Allocatelliglobosispora scoriae TaxID=643052 RepID=A0A841BNI2_9ACTN|nr:AI-2E family transporter [Allocatelliglobosispora scoriae]MBB5870647.1 putative PurR-regulated permease PerM [Allocatelliglobosispora scoriae]